MYIDTRDVAPIKASKVDERRPLLQPIPEEAELSPPDDERHEESEMFAPEDSLDYTLTHN